MDLYLFPEAACMKDGYGMAVESAYRRLKPSKNDIVVWRSSYPKNEIAHYKEGDYIIPFSKRFSARTLIRLIQGRPHLENSVRDLSFLKGKDFDNIHCDDVAFFKALRKMFPGKTITVRLHNCFSRIWARNIFLKRDIGFLYSINLRLMLRSERDIFNDSKAYKIFLSNEDCDFYRRTYGKNSDSETWPLKPDEERMSRNRKPIVLDHNLVWFGGVQAHKESSLRWFIKDVLPEIQKELPDVEFHLWGRDTQQFNNPRKGVNAHGFWCGDGFPMSKSLYVNPDIIGGGVKIKLMTLIENGVPFISTPFGFEGYNASLIDGKYCNVVEESMWAEAIVKKLK